jgi:hypothetical protein
MHLKGKGTMCDFKQETLGIFSNLFIKTFKRGAMMHLMVSLQYEIATLSLYR